jgi:hypothetical protein
VETKIEPFFILAETMTVNTVDTVLTLTKKIFILRSNTVVLGSLEVKRTESSNYPNKIKIYKYYKYNIKQ